MMTFFQNQMDFIFFFYGLAFIFLALSSFLLYFQQKNERSWFYLGLFGVLHGINEWIEMVKSMFYINNNWFEFVRLFFLASSFIFLIEFGRRVISSKGKIKIGFWLYVLLAIVLWSAWYFLGRTGLEIFVRFLLGFGGAALAGLSFWQVSLLSKKFISIFKIIAVLFFVYAVTQLINSTGQILNIRWTDQSIFFASTGIPVQLIRAVLSLSISFCVWSYSQNLYFKENEQKETNKNKLLNRIFLAILTSIIILSWAGCNLLSYLAYLEIKTNNQTYSNILNSSLERILLVGKDLSLVLSGSPNIISMLEKPTIESVQAANVVVDRYAATNNVDIAYVLNKEGVVLATSNRNAPDSLLNNNYAFRSYFTQALNGSQSNLFAFGVTTKKPGYYSSSPIKNSSGNIIGVAVIKLDLSFVEKSFKQFGLIFLLSPENIIFLSGDSKYALKSLEPLSLKNLETIIQSKQYNVNNFQSLFERSPNNNDIISLNGGKYLFDTKPINGEGWKLAVLHSSNLILYYRLFGFSISLVICFLVIFSFVTIQGIKRNKFLSYADSIISSSGDAVVGVDLHGKIVSWNKGAEKIYGYKSDDILGKNIEAIISKNKINDNELVFNQIINGKQKEHFETVHIKNNGEQIDVSLRFSLTKDEDKEAIGVSMVSRDITKEKNIEKSLKKHTEELEKFKLAVDASTDSVVITDKNARILYMNKAAEIMSGFNMKDVEGMYIGGIWGGHMEKVFYEKMWDVIKNKKKSFVSDFKNRRKNGEEYFVNAKIYPILDEFKEVKFFVGVETDITKIKEMERVKSEFISVTSHQLRTPLTGIKWFTELLLKGKAGSLKTEQKDYVQQVADSNDRMIRLVDDLLDVSHIDEAGKFKVILEKDDFSTILKEVVDQQKIIADKKQIKIKLSSECKQKMLLKVDREKIEQAMQNILSNAIKYSIDGGTVSIGCQKNDDNYVCSFTDSGIGIPLYQQPRVFEKFFRADNVITVGSGTGLGLYIAKFIVESHDGKIWFESKENKGTTFYISLPIK